MDGVQLNGKHPIQIEKERDAGTGTRVMPETSMSLPLRTCGKFDNVTLSISLDPGPLPLGKLFDICRPANRRSLVRRMGPTQSDRSLHRSGNPPSHRPLAQEPVLDHEETRGMPNPVRNGTAFSAWVTERIERWSVVEQEPHGLSQPFPVGGEPWCGVGSTLICLAG